MSKPPTHVALSVAQELALRASTTDATVFAVEVSRVHAGTPPTFTATLDVTAPYPPSETARDQLTEDLRGIRHPEPTVCTWEHFGFGSMDMRTDMPDPLLEASLTADFTLDGDGDPDDTGDTPGGDG